MPYGHLHLAGLQTARAVRDGPMIGPSPTECVKVYGVGMARFTHYGKPGPDGPSSL